MTAKTPTPQKTATSRKERSSEVRNHPRERQTGHAAIDEDCPPAGAHAASHLINEDATPGAGVLPGHRRSGKEVDVGAG